MTDPTWGQRGWMSSESTLSPLQTFFNVIWIYLHSSKAQNTRAKEINCSLLKRASENCEHKHHVINGPSVPWILNILVALINQSQKCHYRKNSLLLYFFFFTLSLSETQCCTGSFETTKIPLQVHLGLLHWERNNRKVSFAHLLFALIAMVCRW